MSYHADKHMITVHTDAQTSAGNDNTEGQNGPRVKMRTNIIKIGTLSAK